MEQEKKIIGGSFCYKSVEQREAFRRACRDKENLSVSQVIRRFIEGYLEPKA